jgi:hypothetical protein
MANLLAGFQARTEIANWVNVAALAVTFFLLISFIVLPIKWTHRHYLSVCLTIGVMFIEVSIFRAVIGDSAKANSSLSWYRWPQTLTNVITPLLPTIWSLKGLVQSAVLFFYSEDGLLSFGCSFEHSPCICRYAGSWYLDRNSSTQLCFSVGPSQLPGWPSRCL